MSTNLDSSESVPAAKQGFAELLEPLLNIENSDISSVEREEHSGEDVNAVVEFILDAKKAGDWTKPLSLKQSQIYPQAINSVTDELLNNITESNFKVLKSFRTSIAKNSQASGYLISRLQVLENLGIKPVAFIDLVLSSSANRKLPCEIDNWNSAEFLLRQFGAYSIAVNGMSNIDQRKKAKEKCSDYLVFILENITLQDETFTHTLSESNTFKELSVDDWVKILGTKKLNQKIRKLKADSLVNQCLIESIKKSDAKATEIASLILLTDLWKLSVVRDVAKEFLERSAGMNRGIGNLIQDILSEEKKTKIQTDLKLKDDIISELIDQIDTLESNLENKSGLVTDLRVDEKVRREQKVEALQNEKISSYKEILMIVNKYLLRVVHGGDYGLYLNAQQAFTEGLKSLKIDSIGVIGEETDADPNLHANLPARANRVRILESGYKQISSDHPFILALVEVKNQERT